MSSADSDGFTSFPIGCLFSFFLLNNSARTSNTVLNNSGRSGHPCLVTDFREAFSFSPLTKMLAVGLYLWPLLCGGIFICIYISDFFLSFYN